MKKMNLLKLAALVALLPWAAARASMIGYQGRVVVNGTNYDGIGNFKFAFVNNGESLSRWSNDGTSIAGSEPSNYVQLTVTKGLFSVELGNTSIGGMTSNITTGILEPSDIYLKVWFSPSNTGFAALSPYLKLTAGAGYSVLAEEALGVRSGGISSSMIGEGQVTSVSIADGAVSEGDLGDNSVSTAKLQNNAVTSAKMADGSVTAAKIASGAVSALGTPNGGTTNAVTVDDAGHVNVGSSPATQLVSLARGDANSAAISYSAANSTWGSQTLPAQSASGSSVGGSGPWTNISDVITSDNLYASAPLTFAGFFATNATDMLRLTNFNFNIPTEASIRGVTASIEGYSTATNGASMSAQLLSVAGTPRNGSIASSEAVNTLGGTNDVWGTSLTPATANSAAFGLSLEFFGSVNATVFVDRLTLTIAYGPATTVQFAAGASFSNNAFVIASGPDLNNALLTIATNGTVAANKFSGDGSGLTNLVTTGLVQKVGDTMTGSLTAPRYLNNNNTANGTKAIALGGSGNSAGGDHATAAGGLSNSAPGDGSTVGGGANNAATGYISTVAGGEANTAGDEAFVGGGHGNRALNYASTVPGGESNLANGAYSFAAGRRAIATNDGDFVWADGTDTNFAATAANQFLIRASGGVGIGTNVTTNALVVAGNVQANNFIGNGMSITGSLSIATVSANRLLNTNNTSGNALAVALGGAGNNAASAYSVVAGGRSNTANQSGATIGGGFLNKASGLEAFVGGGEQNTAGGDYAFVGAGFGNTANGLEAVVAGGDSNLANGFGSFAGGHRAQATNDGDFVWADTTDTNFAALGVNQFVIRAAGGVGIGTNNPSAQLHVNGNELLDGKLTINSQNNQIGLQLNGTNNTGTWLAMDNTLTGGHSWRFVSTSTNNGEGPGHLLIIDNGPGVRMMISSNGNVGINTTTPTNRLHVVGNIQASSSVMAGAFMAVAQSTLSPANGATLSPTTGYVMLTPANSVTLSVATAISSGSIVGESLILQGNNANSTTLSNGANTHLTATLVTLATNDTLHLIWSGAAWIGIGSQNNL